MTTYKNLVKKKSLRYKKSNTYRRKGRKASAGGTLLQRLNKLFGTRRARIQNGPELIHHTRRTQQQERNNIELTTAINNTVCESADDSVLNRVSNFLTRRSTGTRTEQPPPLPSPTISRQTLSNVDGDVDWRTVTALNTAIRVADKGALIRLAKQIDAEHTVAKQKLYELTKDSKLLNTLKKSKSTEMYISLLCHRGYLLALLKTLVNELVSNSPSGLDKHERKNKLQRYPALVQEITNLEQQIIETRAQIDEDIEYLRPVLPYSAVVAEPSYRANYGSVDYD